MRTAAVLVSIGSMLTPLIVTADNKSAVEPQVLSLPKGPGSIEGLGESFEPQLNTGTAAYKVTLSIPPGVSGHTPEISLLYNNGFGNSSVGLGWRLSVPYLQRQTDKGLPNYTNDDTYIHTDSGELVSLGNGSYRSKIEGSFMRFQQVGGGWEVWDKSGIHRYFGITANSRLETSLGSFEWFLERSVDTNGNEIQYFYEHDNGQIYLKEIRYSLTSATIYKSIHFTYETRPDPFTDYHSRSRILTAKRLTAVELRSQGVLARKYVFKYQANSDSSLLSSIQQLGSDGITALPPLSFSYSSYNPANVRTVAMTDSPPTGVDLSNVNVDLIDIDGDSLPDLVHTPSSQGMHNFYINEGNAQWKSEAVAPNNSPQYFLQSNDVLMSDMNGDGLADLFVHDPFEFGYFRNRGHLTWEENDFINYGGSPNFNFEDPRTELLDINNDKLIDVLRDTGTSYQIWLNPGDGQWNNVFDAETNLPGNDHLNLDSAFTKVGDMNGDRMTDLVQVMDSYVAYYPSMGNGEFDTSVEMIDTPTGLGADASKLTLTDINNDGLSDLALIGNGSVRVWFNAGNNIFKDVTEFIDTPSYTVNNAGYRFADMNGDGFRDLLITNNFSADTYQYVDFNNGIHPNLLTKIDNGLGMETTISYKSSTEDYLRDRDAGKPWSRKLPFPVQVVSRVTVRDKNSDQQYIADYFYRDGYYDGAEKEFRGFGSVRRLEYGDASAPALQSQYVFDVGDVEESRKGMALSEALLEESGTVSPQSGLFEIRNNQLTTRTLANGTGGIPVKYSFTSETRARIYEKTTSAKELLRRWNQDSYGNITEDLNYGIVAGTDLKASKDEVLTYTTYLLDTNRWIVDRPLEIRKKNADGGFIAHQRMTYDANGNLKKDEQSLDGTRFISLVLNDYDAFGNIIKITDANNHSRTLQYDATFHTFPVRETIDQLGLTMTAEYNLGLGVMTAFTDANSRTTQFRYDPLARLTTIVRPGDTLALPTQSFTYNLSSPVSSITTRNREQFGQSGMYETVAYFDGLGRKLQTRSEAENGQWTVTEAVIFNQRKGIQRQWLPYFATTHVYGVPAVNLPYTDFRYDARGRSLRETNPDGSFRSVLYRPLERTEYDEEDNNLGGTHANTPHDFAYDGRERLIEVRERNKGAVYITRYEYDGLDNLIKITDNESNIKTLTFDGLGRKTFMNDPDKGVMNYAYDNAGNLVSTTDAKGQTVTYTYDAGNRSVTENFQGVKVRYHYDSDLPVAYPNLLNTRSRLVWVEDEAGREFYSYDARGNVTRTIRELDGLRFVTDMEYDALDRLTRLIYPDGTAVQYIYNTMNQLESIPGYVNNIDYLATGQKVKFVYANGITSDYQYDNRQRMTRLRSLRNTEPLQNLTYSYDRVSNITRISDERPSNLRTPEDRSTDYTYDDLYRLTDAVAPSWSERYQYNSIGNMLFKSDLGTMSYGAGTAGPHALTQANGANYTYDANGNMAAKQGFVYTFDHKDRLTRVDRTTDGMVIRHAYDYRHDRKRKTVTLNGATETTLYADRYTELRKDRLVKQVFAGDRLVARVMVEPFNAGILRTDKAPLTVANFDVNPKNGTISVAEIRAQGADPTRVEASEAADALRLYYENQENSPGLISFATMAEVIHSLGSSLPSQPVTQKTYFYLLDHLGSASVVTDEIGAIAEVLVFYPYGENRIQDSVFESEYRFTSKELDRNIELYYFGARYYDPKTGSFISIDPFFMEKNDGYIKKNSTSNFYSYANNNPLSFSDKTGLFEVDITSFGRNTKNYLVDIGNKSKDKIIETSRNLNSSARNFLSETNDFLSTPINQMNEEQLSNPFTRSAIAIDSITRRIAPKASIGFSGSVNYKEVGGSLGYSFRASAGRVYTEGSPIAIVETLNGDLSFPYEKFGTGVSLDFNITLIPERDNNLSYGIKNIGPWSVMINKDSLSLGISYGSRGKPQFSVSTEIQERELIGSER